MDVSPIQDATGRHRILHLSDTHLTGSGYDEDGVDAAAALDRLLDDVRFVPDLDLVVVSGDVADDGSEAGCAGVRDRIGRFAAERGIPQVYSTGNHDDRASFASVLGSGHLDSEGVDVGQLSDPAGPERAAVSDVAGLRVITLDSLVPGSVHGAIGEGQLAWLRETLAHPAPAGSIVVLHHPPVYLDRSPWMPSFVLQNVDALGEVLAGTDVRMVLCGHLHLQLSGVLAGVPVNVTPGIVTRIDLTPPPHLIRGVKGAGATVVDLGGRFSPTSYTVHARDPEAGEQVYLVDPLSWTAVAEEGPTEGAAGDRTYDAS